MQSIGDQMMVYRKFGTDKKNYADLSQEDKSLVRILEGIAKDISQLYKLQLKEGFYPRTVTKAQLEKAAKKSPEILSPFTFVAEKNGSLEATFYHNHYAKYLKPIAKKIEKAADICTNQSFKAYLRVQARAMLDGSYEEAYRQWLNVRNSKLDFNIGPFERHLDRTFFIKRSFQAHVGIIDRKYTELAEKHKETLYSSAKMSSGKYHSTDIPKKGVSVFVESITAISGYPADVLSSGQHFPADLATALKYGSKIIIYTSQYRLKFDKLYYPIFQTIFEKRFSSKYSRELLLEATCWCILLYELGKQLHRFEAARERLQELYGPLDEANGFASGIEHSKHLVVKGSLSQDDLEAIIIIHILWMLADWLLFKENTSKQNHILGNSLLLNSYLSHGALRVNSGISWPNFSRIFFEIEEMAYKLVYLLQKGSYKEAGEFIKQNADLNSFERLSKTLTKMNTQI